MRSCCGGHRLRTGRRSSSPSRAAAVCLQPRGAMLPTSAVTSRSTSRASKSTPSDRSRTHRRITACLDSTLGHRAELSTAAQACKSCKATVSGPQWPRDVYTVGLLFALHGAAGAHEQCVECALASQYPAALILKTPSVAHTCVSCTPRESEASVNPPSLASASGPAVAEGCSTAHAAAAT